jgi:glycosyltransferase involved in cell wall biosynthesis
MLRPIQCLSIVIPCFNESNVIPTLMPRVIETLNILKEQKLIIEFELIVANDQSTDESDQRLSQFKEVKMITTTSKKRGYGGALKAGFQNAKGDWICFFDMDNSYRPENLSDFINEIYKGESDFIMGSRDFSEKGMSYTRGLGNWIYKVLTNLLYGVRLNDVCSGYRFFHRKHLPEILEINENGLNFSIQLTLNMILQKVFVKQIPISYDQRMGESKLSLVKDGFAFLKVIFNLKLRRHNAFKHSRV